MQPQRDERSLGELFADLTRDLGRLVRQEVGLASAEMSSKAERAARDLAIMAVGGLLAYAGLLAVLAAIIIGLAAAGLAWWLAALVVGIVVLVIGALVIQRGRSGLSHLELTPRQTVDTLREDTQWAKEQIS